jgi:hypothetical protein
MAAANVNVPDILDEALYAMEEDDAEEEDAGTDDEEAEGDEEDDEEDEDEVEDVEDVEEDEEEVEDEAEEDRDLLMYSLTVFGYNANTCEAIVDGLNIRVPMDLVSFSDTRLDTLAALLLRRHKYQANARIKLPLTVGDDLHVYKMWATERVWQGRPLTADLFDEAAVARTRARLDELRVIQLAAKPAPTAPMAFKGQEVFIEFKRAFDHACDGLRGACGVPISWVYREHGAVTAAMRAADYATYDEYLMATIKTKGQHFDTDSASVFKLLWKAVENSETALTYVRPFHDAKNGRRAMLALIDWCGNAATSKARSKAANAVIHKAIWDGKPRRNFHFEDFNAQMKAAFDELALLNEPVANHVQIGYYLEAIVDPKLDVAKATVQAHPTMQDSFDEASHYMAIMHLQASVTKKTGVRVVAEAGDGGRKGQRKRKSKRNVPDPERPHIHDGSYSDEDWKDLTKDEQNEVKQLHKKKFAKADKAKAGDDDAADEERADES